LRKPKDKRPSDTSADRPLGLNKQLQSAPKGRNTIVGIKEANDADEQEIPDPFDKAKQTEEPYH